jgi:hypothetical protein
MAELDRCREIADSKENETCADCEATKPDWAAINIGIWLCIKCAGIHRNLGVEFSVVRSLDLDTECWDKEIADYMEAVGNVRGREQYEALCPVYYMRPDDKINISPAIRENWIRAKYQRKEFERDTGVDPVHLMPERARQGWLQKANEKGKWQKRWFVLHHRHLYWFAEEFDSYPKGFLDITAINVLLPERWTLENGWVFHLDSSERERVYPVSAESQGDMWNWLNAIKRAALYYQCIQPAKHQGPPEDVKKQEEKQLTFADVKALDIKMKGSLNKQGGKWVSNWRGRHSLLSAEGKLYYFKEKAKNEALCEGVISVLDTDVRDCPSHARPNTFSIISEGRLYFLQARSAMEKDQWINNINSLIDAVPKDVVDFKNGSSFSGKI